MMNKKLKIGDKIKCSSKEELLELHNQLTLLDDWMTDFEYFDENGLPCYMIKIVGRYVNENEV